MKSKVLMVLQGYPTISQTYMTNEVDALKDAYDLRIVSTKQGNLPGKDYHAFEVVTEKGRMREIVEEFRPHILHGHYLHTAKLLAELGERYRIPFTIRTHSFDSLKRWDRKPRLGFPEVRAACSDACAGVLVFPFVRPLMESVGVPAAKLIDCYPVINYRRFHDRSSNGDSILNVGACIPKKRMEDFVNLGKLVDKPLNIYAIGYEHESLRAYNEANGSPVCVHQAVEPQEMPAVYKAHGWLVYTADFKLKTVGWPMAVAEAQAAGVGICFPNIRPDVSEYVGGAGFLYDSIEQAAGIVRSPCPEEVRERGFEQARKSDIEEHKHLLTDIWDRVAGTQPRAGLRTSYRLYSAATEPLRAAMRATRGKSDKAARSTDHH